jgi:hypothetical protein
LPRRASPAARAGLQLGLARLDAADENLVLLDREDGLADFRIKRGLAVEGIGKRLLVIAARSSAKAPGAGSLRPRLSGEGG